MEPVGQLLLLDRQICFALYSAQRSMEQAYRPLLKGLGRNLTYPQYLVMLVLWEHDGQSVANLGERLHLDSGTLSPLLQRLEGRGLLERRRSEQDERRVEAFLTARGRKLQEKARLIPRQLLRCASLSLDQADAFRSQLQQLTSALGRLTTPAP